MVIQQRTNILASYYAEFSHFSTLFNYQVLRGGHIQTARNEHHIKRKTMPGHEFILCLKGAGWVKIDNTVYRVAKNNLVWLPIKYPHEHYPDPDSPWEIYWLRIQGGNLETLMYFLNIQFSPVFYFDDITEISEIFRTIFSAMEQQNLLSGALKDEQVAQLIQTILSHTEHYSNSIINHKSLRHLITHIQNHYMDDWNIEKLASFCNLSKSQLIRLFKSTFDDTPMKWIKKYRLSQAQYLLVKTEEHVAEIALQVGYKDPLHFSREFKLFSGSSPTNFRIREKQSLGKY